VLKIIAIGIFLLGSSAYSNPKFDGSYVNPSECIILANQQLSDMGMGTGVFYPPPLSFDTNGKIIISDKSRIVKRVLKDGSETITYKTKMSGPYGGDGNEVEKTIVITRNDGGKLTSIFKLYDKNNPIASSFQQDFSYKGNECSLNQNFITKDKNGNLEKKVIFDKKFCDQLAPIMKQMGAQNAAMCGNLIVQAQGAYNTRNDELAKEGKSFQSYYKSSKAKDFISPFNVGTAVQSCTYVGGMGPFGMGGGYGMNPYGGIGMGMGGLPSDSDSASK
jgi:hypothetical protein